MSIESCNKYCAFVFEEDAETPTSIGSYPTEKRPVEPFWLTLSPMELSIMIYTRKSRSGLWKSLETLSISKKLFTTAACWIDVWTSMPPIQDI